MEQKLTYNFSFTAQDEAKAFLHYVEIRVMNFNQRHDASSQVKLSYEFAEDDQSCLALTFTASSEFISGMELMSPNLAGGSLFERKEGRKETKTELNRVSLLPIGHLDVHGKARNACLNAGLFYVGDLLALNKEQLLKIPKLGASSYRRISWVLEDKFGLCLEENGISKGKPDWALQFADEVSELRFIKLKDLSFDGLKLALLERLWTLGLVYVGDLLAMTGREFVKRLQNSICPYTVQELDKCIVFLAEQGLYFGTLPKDWRPENVEELSQKCYREYPEYLK